MAIALVFVYHYSVVVSGENTFGWPSEFGWTGVDLFFVLSGYLIANQLFAGYARGERSLCVVAFYLRRGLRTWPAFAVVLIAYLGWREQLGGSEPPPWWRFATFTQNWGLKPGTAFSHAWSLCIEEQFYFVLPLAVLAGVAWARRVSQRRVWFWVLIASLTAVGVVARAVLWARYGADTEHIATGYYPWVYYATLTRFDEFLPGVAVAFVRYFHPKLWAGLMQRGNGILALAAVAVGAMWYGVLAHYFNDERGYLPFMTIAGYSLMAWAYALAVVAALSDKTPLHRWRVPGVAQLALWSYSIYLTHKAVMFVVSQAFKAHGLGPEWVVPGVVVLSVLVGALLYHAVELPFMRWRDRIAPRLFVGPCVRQIAA